MLAVGNLVIECEGKKGLSVIFIEKGLAFLYCIFQICNTAHIKYVT